MKTPQALETLTDLEHEAFEKLEIAIATHEEATIIYVEALREIRDRRLYREQFSTFAKYCEAKWGKSYRAINMAIQADEMRQSLGLGSVSQISDNAARALTEIEPEQRKAIVAKATKGGKKATPKRIREAAGIAPRGGFGAYTGAPVNTDSYTSDQAPAARSVPVAAASDESEPADMPAITDKWTAIECVKMIYEREKEWFNAVPPRPPRDIVERLIERMSA